MTNVTGGLTANKPWLAACPTLVVNCGATLLLPVYIVLFIIVNNIVIIVLVIL